MIGFYNYEPLLYIGTKHMYRNRREENYIMIKICQFCGKKFKANSNHQRYCKGPHIRICPVCGKEYVEDNVENLKRPPVACSYECRVKKTRQTSLKKYGITAPGNNKAARQKAKDTMKEKYGAAYTLQCPELYDKAQSTILSKYGVDNVAKSQDVKARRAHTSQFKYRSSTYLTSEEGKQKISDIMKSKYGTDVPLHSAEIVKRLNNTCNERYGNDWVYGSDYFEKKSKETRFDRYGQYEGPETKSKRINTCLKRYGVENPSMHQTFIDKIRNTMIERYGVPGVLSVEHIRNKIKETSMKRYGVPYYIMLPDVCKSSGRFSKTNQHFAELLDKEHLKYEIEYRIDSSFYDFYLPQSNTLIEIDPTYTHSLIDNHWRSRLDPDYHINKSKLAEINRFKCFHVFDWDNPVRFIKSLIQKKSISQYATREISPESAKVFLSNYSTSLLVDADVYVANTHDDNIIQLAAVNLLDDRVNVINITTKFYYNVNHGLKSMIDYVQGKYCKPMYYIEDSAKPQSGLLKSALFEPLTYIQPEVIWSRNRHAFSSYKLFQDAKNEDEYIDKQADMILQGFRPVMNCGYRLWVRNM